MSAAPPPRLPSVDALLRDAALAPLLAQYGRSSTTTAVRHVLDGLRPQLRAGTLQAEQVQADALATRVQQTLQRTCGARLQPVFNLTGTVLHTTLGRALLPQEVVASA